MKKIKNKNKKPPARIKFQKKKDDKLTFFLMRLIYNFSIWNEKSIFKKVKYAYIR